MFNKFIYESDDIIVDYLRYKGKFFYLKNTIRKNHISSLSNMVIVDFVMIGMGNIKSTYIINMDEYFLWKRVLKLKQLKTKMI